MYPQQIRDFDTNMKKVSTTQIYYRNKLDKLVAYKETVDRLKCIMCKDLVVRSSYRCLRRTCRKVYCEDCLLAKYAKFEQLEEPCCCSDGNEQIGDQLDHEFEQLFVKCPWTWVSKEKCRPVNYLTFLLLLERSDQDLLAHQPDNHIQNCKF